MIGWLHHLAFQYCAKNNLLMSSVHCYAQGLSETSPRGRTYPRYMLCRLEGNVWTGQAGAMELKDIVMPLICSALPTHCLAPNRRPWRRRLWRRLFPQITSQRRRRLLLPMISRPRFFSEVVMPSFPGLLCPQFLVFGGHFLAQARQDFVSLNLLNVASSFMIHSI
jgi:hypothetical protein